LKNDFIVEEASINS